MLQRSAYPAYFGGVAAWLITCVAAHATTYTPSQIRSAYGFSSLPSNVTGTGQTIGIIDFENAPNITSDLAKFNTTYNVAAAPSFSIYNESGGTTLPATGSSGEILETTLDVEYAHAIAPGASIVLIEAGSISTATSSDFVTLANTAVAKGASVVSMSFGYNGGASAATETMVDAAYNQTGVTFVASSGDSGKFGYPASSPHVIGVGGTSLVIANSTNAGYTNATGGTYVSETPWNNSSGSGGGGVDPNEPIPAYQVGVSGEASTNFRNIPDLSYDADPSTGVDLVLNGNAIGGVGGTSAGAPQIAGMIALANQLRASEGMALLSSDQALTMLYTASADKTLYFELFHDIASGSISSGYTATTGYDNATGLGTPIANDVVDYLAGLPAPEPSCTCFAAAVGMLMLRRRQRSVNSASAALSKAD